MLSARLLLVTLVLCPAAALAAGGARARALRPAKPPQASRDTVLAKGACNGTFVGFEVGDYIHASLQSPDRKTRSFRVGEGFLHYFLAINLNRAVTVTFHRVREYVPQAGGFETFERIVDAKTGATSYGEWLKSVQKGKTRGEIIDAFEPVFEKAIKGAF